MIAAVFGPKVDMFLIKLLGINTNRMVLLLESETLFSFLKIKAVLHFTSSSSYTDY